jgi:predicted ATPase/DNA-binding CsgD family transcriptional regulator
MFGLTRCRHPVGVAEDGARGGVWPLLLEPGVSDAEESAFSLPTGIVTFLTGEVLTSASQWEHAPDTLATVVSSHLELLDAAIESRGGIRLTGGDAPDFTLAAFSRASDAMTAAVTAQLAFAAEARPAAARLQVRMAVHAGEAHLRDDRSYFGHALDRCRRMLAIGHGGQVLVSAASMALVADRLPADMTLVELGWHRLSDLGRPEHIWQAVHPELPPVFPPLRSLDTFRHNLPIQLTPLIGRHVEVAEVRRHLGADRLVTLTGSAGVGKTRLALAVAAELPDRYPGGVWWVDLAPLADGGAIGRTALAALGARETAGPPIAHQLARALGEQPSLLVVDNCEHLVDPCAALLSDLLAANANASVLATSREAVGVPGEITWRVPSLRCPQRERLASIPTLSQYDAVILFVERARRARPSFTVDNANAPAVAEICHRLDGIPLAIELAAARCRQMSAERIASELDDRFRLLTGGARTVMARQQTLGASIDWSHDLLGDDERVVFRRLGVFAGSFPLEAAEAVVAVVGGIERLDVFDLLSRLVDKSLVVASEGPGGSPRYRLLESLRAYALDRAREAGELAACRDAHARWWADWLEPRGAMPTDELLDEIEEFHTNLKAALDWSTNQPALGLRLLRDVSVAWMDIGRAGDALDAADRLLTDANAEEHVDAWLAAAWRAGFLSFQARGPEDLVPLSERIEAVAARRGDQLYGTLARGLQGEPLSADPDLLGVALERGDRYVAAWVLTAQACELGELDPMAAAPLIDQGAAAAAACGVRSLKVVANMASAEAAASRGDLRSAIETTRRLLEDPGAAWMNDAVRILSYAGLLGVDEESICLAVEGAERVDRETPGLAGWSRHADHRRALLEGAASETDPEMTDDTALRWPPTVGTLWLYSREAIDAGDSGVAVDWARSWEFSGPHAEAVLAAIEAAATGDEDRWHDALAIAVENDLRLVAVDALEGLAVAAARAESRAECLRLLGAAERLRDETGYRWRFGLEERAVAAARADAAAAVGDTTPDAEAEGRDLDWREAAAYARRARGERKRPRYGWASLTPTELQVVALIAEGLTNPQIASRLLMGRATVKTHLEHIFTKLGVHTRAELAAQAARRWP